MRHSTLQETIEYRSCVIEVHYDEGAESPRDWSNLGTMVCWHRRYNLGDEQPRQDPSEYLEKLASKEYWRECERLDFRLDEVQHYFGWGDRLRRAETAVERRKETLLEADMQANTVRLPLYLYDHSGITMSTGSFSCPWDSGQVGFIYCTLERARLNWTRPDATWETLIPWDEGKEITMREAAVKVLEGEVETYDQYLTGNVYGYVAKGYGGGDDGDREDIASCWGFFPDSGKWGIPAHAIDEAKAEIDAWIKSYGEKVGQSGEHEFTA